MIIRRYVRCLMRSPAVTSSAGASSRFVVRRRTAEEEQPTLSTPESLSTLPAPAAAPECVATPVVMTQNQREFHGAILRQQCDSLDNVDRCSLSTVIEVYHALHRSTGDPLTVSLPPSLCFAAIRCMREESTQTPQTDVSEDIWMFETSLQPHLLRESRLPLLVQGLLILLHPSVVAAVGSTDVSALKLLISSVMDHISCVMVASKGSNLCLSWLCEPHDVHQIELLLNISCFWPRSEDGREYRSLLMLSSNSASRSKIIKFLTRSKSFSERIVALGIAENVVIQLSRCLKARSGRLNDFSRDHVVIFSWCLELYLLGSSTAIESVLQTCRRHKSPQFVDLVVLTACRMPPSVVRFAVSATCVLRQSITVLGLVLDMGCVDAANWQAVPVPLRRCAVIAVVEAFVLSHRALRSPRTFLDHVGVMVFNISQRSRSTLHRMAAGNHLKLIGESIGTDDGYLLIEAFTCECNELMCTINVREGLLDAPDDVTVLTKDDTILTSTSLELLDQLVPHFVNVVHDKGFVGSRRKKTKAYVLITRAARALRRLSDAMTRRMQHSKDTFQEDLATIERLQHTLLTNSSSIFDDRGFEFSVWLLHGIVARDHVTKAKRSKRIVELLNACWDMRSRLSLMKVCRSENLGNADPRLPLRIYLAGRLLAMVVSDVSLASSASGMAWCTSEEDQKIVFRLVSALLEPTDVSESSRNETDQLADSKAEDDVVTEMGIGCLLDTASGEVSPSFRRLMLVNSEFPVHLPMHCELIFRVQFSALASGKETLAAAEGNHGLLLQRLASLTPIKTRMLRHVRESRTASSETLGWYIGERWWGTWLACALRSPPEATPEEDSVPSRDILRHLGLPVLKVVIQVIQRLCLMPPFCTSSLDMAMSTLEACFHSVSIAVERGPDAEKEIRPDDRLDFDKALLTTDDLEWVYQLNVSSKISLPRLLAFKENIRQGMKSMSPSMISQIALRVHGALLSMQQQKISSSPPSPPDEGSVSLGEVVLGVAATCREGMEHLLDGNASALLHVSLSLGFEEFKEHILPLLCRKPSTPPTAPANNDRSSTNENEQDISVFLFNAMGYLSSSSSSSRETSRRAGGGEDAYHAQRVILKILDAAFTQRAFGDLSVASLVQSLQFLSKVSSSSSTTLASVDMDHTVCNCLSLLKERLPCVQSHEVRIITLHLVALQRRMSATTNKEITSILSLLLLEPYCNGGEAKEEWTSMSEWVRFMKHELLLPQSTARILHHILVKKLEAILTKLPVTQPTVAEAFDVLSTLRQYGMDSSVIRLRLALVYFAQPTDVSERSAGGDVTRCSSSALFNLLRELLLNVTASTLPTSSPTDENALSEATTINLGHHQTRRPSFSSSLPEDLVLLGCERIVSATVAEASGAAGVVDHSQNKTQPFDVALSSSLAENAMRLKLLDLLVEAKRFGSIAAAATCNSLLVAPHASLTPNECSSVLQVISKLNLWALIPGGVTKISAIASAKLVSADGHTKVLILRALASSSSGHYEGREVVEDSANHDDDVPPSYQLLEMIMKDLDINFSEVSTDDFVSILSAIRQLRSKDEGCCFACPAIAGGCVRLLQDILQALLRIPSGEVKAHIYVVAIQTMASIFAHDETDSLKLLPYHEDDDQESSSSLVGKEGSIDIQSTVSTFLQCLGTGGGGSRVLPTGGSIAAVRLDPQQTVTILKCCHRLHVLPSEMFLLQCCLRWEKTVKHEMPCAIVVDVMEVILAFGLAFQPWMEHLMHRVLEERDGIRGGVGGHSSLKVVEVLRLFGCEYAVALPPTCRPKRQH